MSTPKDQNDYDLIARYYDIEHGSFQEDIQLYRNYALEAGAPVLEAGCGSGRLLFPLARERLLITGVDSSTEMLERARVRLASLPDPGLVTLHQADVRTMRIKTRFALAFLALDSFGHLTERGHQETALETLHQHLQSGGLLVLDLSNPTTLRLDAIEGQMIHHFTGPDPETGHLVSHFSVTSSDTAEQVLSTLHFYDEIAGSGSGPLQRTVARTSLRYFTRPEIELLLTLTGFAIREIHGSYALDSYSADSPRLIVVAERAT